MKNSEVKNKHKNKYGKLRTILSFWYFKRKIVLCGILMKHKCRLCAHGGMQKWGVNYWGPYDKLVNWISVKSLFDISSIHVLPSRSIDFVLEFPLADLDVDILMELPLGMGVDENKVEWLLKLNKSLYGLKKSSENWFDIIKLVYKGGVTINLKLTLVYFTEDTHLFLPMLMIV